MPSLAPPFLWKFLPSRTGRNCRGVFESQGASSGQNQSEGKTFTGKISKSNGRYVLEGQSMNSTYYLDDAKAAQKFEGQNVKVTGTLDAENRTIHVEKIEAA